MIRAAALLILLMPLAAGPAQSAGQLWVAKSLTTGKCAVVKSRPEGVVRKDVSKKIYVSMGDALKDLKFNEQCRPLPPVNMKAWKEGVPKRSGP